MLSWGPESFNLPGERENISHETGSLENPRLKSDLVGDMVSFQEMNHIFGVRDLSFGQVQCVSNPLLGLMYILGMAQDLFHQRKSIQFECRVF